MLVLEDNPIKYAVAKIGGPTKTALALGVAGATVHLWIRNNKISDIDKAKKVSILSGVSVDLLRPI